jgi:hypothetical protein
LVHHLACSCTSLRAAPLDVKISQFSSISQKYIKESENFNKADAKVSMDYMKIGKRSEQINSKNQKWIPPHNNNAYKANCDANLGLGGYQCIATVIRDSAKNDSGVKLEGTCIYGQNSSCAASAERHPELLLAGHRS